MNPSIQPGDLFVVERDYIVVSSSLTRVYLKQNDLLIFFGRKKCVRGGVRWSVFLTSFEQFIEIYSFDLVDNTLSVLARKGIKRI